MIRILAVLAALICAAPAIAQPLPAALDKQNAIVIDTTKGRIVIKLRTDIAPQHAERIKQLAREGYYNNVPFHRVMDGFMAQTGDGRISMAPAARNIRTLSRSFPRFISRAALSAWHGAATASTPPIRSSHHVRRGNSPRWPVHRDRRVVQGMDVVDKLKKAPPGSQGGSVTDPDKMVKVQVASDIK